MKNPLRFLGIIVSDYWNLIKVCGPIVATRWLTMVLIKFKACCRAKNLQPADYAMGKGPFTVTLGTAHAQLTGTQVFSGIREIWARNVYLGGQFLKIPDHGTVVDLGANMGNFTLLALGHGPGVRVVAVEPRQTQCQKWHRAINEAGWSGRATLFHAFVGENLAQNKNDGYQEEFKGVHYLSETELLGKAQIDHIDLLKVDIEGSEFSLLTPDSQLLAITDQLAIEVHDIGGQRHEFIEMLKSTGYEVVIRKENLYDCILNARRRPSKSP